jgi:hypothetical protein
MNATDLEALHSNLLPYPENDDDRDPVRDWMHHPWQVGEYVTANDAYALLCILGERPPMVRALEAIASWIANRHPPTFVTNVDLLRLWCAERLPPGYNPQDFDDTGAACGRLRERLIDRRLIDRVLLGSDGGALVGVYVDANPYQYVELTCESRIAFVMPMSRPGGHSLTDAWSSRGANEVPQFDAEMAV